MKTFVGFGFGPIQSALFLYEAYQSGNFSRYVVAEVDAALVAAVRAASGAYTINIARKGRTDKVRIAGVELYNPADPADRQKLLAAIASADELATSLPSVAFFDRGNETSVARLLADELSASASRPPAVIYAAENHNHAAELLREAVVRHSGEAALQNVQFLNTVIGKMSGVITDERDIRQLGLATLTPATPRAVLVEEFNRILISRIALAGFRRGIEVFVEKDDLLPFEEAKLYGHNAIHALIGYLADLRGLATMAQAASHADIMTIARSAFLGESGAALCRKYAGLGDSLFAPAGYRDYAEDLLERMVRPNLHDLIARVTRDHVRKLGYDDRLFGTMRLALDQGIQPRSLAMGAGAAVLSLIRRQGELAATVEGLPKSAAELTEASLGRLLMGIWGKAAGPQAQEMIHLTFAAVAGLCGGSDIPV